MFANLSLPARDEPDIALWYICRGRKLSLRSEARFNAEVQGQDTFYLEMREGSFNLQSSSDYSQIRDYVPTIINFFARHVNSCAHVMTGLTCASFYLRNEDRIVTYSLANNYNEAWINIVDDRGRRAEFVCESIPESNFTTEAEFHLINDFVGSNRTVPWLLSVLWLFSELALLRFGIER